MENWGPIRLSLAGIALGLAICCSIRPLCWLMVEGGQYLETIIGGR